MTPQIVTGGSTSQERIEALDGLRGIAALVVVIYHYLCLMHPTLAPSMVTSTRPLADTPLHLLWNGSFAVAVFFVLSGFVMAAAASRRRKALWSNCTMRYLRLALPVTVSCLLAWLWLTAFPDSARTMAAALEEPSRWLQYTYQEPIKPVWYAVADGLAGNFIRGQSRFNNVLWTMKIELLGSLGIFLLYYLTNERVRILALVIAALVIVKYLPDPYLGFVLGAALYEGRRHDVLQLPLSVGTRTYAGALSWGALVIALLLGFPGEGAHERLGLPPVPEQWQLGRSRGVMPVIAAALLLYAVLTLPALALAFAKGWPVWLGRISFGLYLLHVPPLYTIVAWSHVEAVLPDAVLVSAYLVGTIALAYVFTLFIDEPLLKKLSSLRSRLSQATDGQVPARADVMTSSWLPWKM